MSHEAKNIKSCKINRKDNSRLGCRGIAGHLFAAKSCTLPKYHTIRKRPECVRTAIGEIKWYRYGQPPGITRLQPSSRVETLTRRACRCRFILDSTSPGSVCRHIDPLQTNFRPPDTCPLPHKQGSRYRGGITRGTHISTPCDTF